MSRLRPERARVLIQRGGAGFWIERGTLQEAEEAARFLHQPEPGGRQRRKARRPGRRKFLACGLGHHRKPPSYDRCRPTAKCRWGKLPMALAAHADTVAGG